jgi:alpha-tubulin suppressor-like RCC1 family protein
VSKAFASGKRRRLLTLTSLAMVLMAAANAQAYWTSSGSGSGVSQAGSLGTPTISGITPGAGTATVTWNAVAPPGSGSVTYYVSRGGGNAGGNCPTSSASSSVLTCTDSGLAAGIYNYTVTAVWHSWTATSSPASSATLVSGALDHFVLSAATTTPTSGAADNLTVTAKDAAGLTVTGYSGSHNLTFSGAGTIGSFVPTVTSSSGAAISFGTVTAISFTNGVATVSGGANGAMTLYKAESAQIVVSDGTHTNGAGLAVTTGAAAIASFAVPTPATQTAGSAFNVSITAKDAYGNIATGYTSSHSLVFTGPANSPSSTAPSYPASVTFTNGVAASVSITLYNVASTTLTATESGKSGSTGAFNVIAAGINSFAIPTPAAQTSGTAFSVSLTARDAWGNTATGYTGSQCIAFAGPANSPSGTPPSYPAQGGCAAGQSSVTFTNGTASPSVTLFNAASTTISVTGSGASGSSGAFAVNPGALDSFGFAPVATQTAGTAFSVSLTAKDAYGNTATGYTGNGKCIAFTGAASSPGGNAPVYPAQGACGANQSSVNFASGIATAAGFTLYNASASTVLTAKDVASTKSGSSAPFAVNPLAINNLRLAAATTTPTAGVADNLTVTARDVYGNTATSYNTALNLTFSGGAGTRTVTNSSGTAIAFGTATALSFANGVASVTGSSNGAMTMNTAQTANVSATGGGYTTNAVSVTVGPGPFASFTIPNPGTRTAGTAFTLTISAFDAYGNASNFSGLRCLTFTGASASPINVAPLYPARGGCGAGQSEVTFTTGSATPSITLYNAVATTLTVTDVTTGTLRAVGPFTVNAGPRGGYHLVPTVTTVTAGVADNLTIYDADAYGNHVAGYTGNRTLTFSGAGSIGTYDPTVIQTGRPTTAIDFRHATTIYFNNGVATVDTNGRNGVMTLYRAETAHIVVSDGAYDNGDGVAVIVNPTALNNISLSAEKVVVRPGATDQLTIRVVDPYGNSAPGYADGLHNLTFSGGSGARTVTNSGGTQVNFGTATPITFTNGISTAGGVMQIATAQTTNITVNDGAGHSSTLRIVVSSVSASAISAGGFHTCALRSDGAVECWGLNDSGQLGNNTLTNSSNPVMVSGPTNVTQLSAGKYHTCAVRSDSTVWCWGSNNYGQVGDNTTTDRSTPTQVHLSAATYLTGVTQVSSGGGHTCALRSDGTVWCWGYNPFGQLGNNASNNSSVAVQVHTSANTNLTNAIQVATGANHTCALISGGTVDCWGYNVYGEIGNGTIDPTMVVHSIATPVVGVGGSGYLTGVSAIGSGRFHSCALISGGSVYCWGDGAHGELGNGATANSPYPVRAGSIDNATTISAGEYHSCASLDDGTAQCWGAAAFGQIGDGTTADTSIPVTVIGPGGFGVLSGIDTISAGGGDINETNDYEHSCALMTDGTVVCWGQNNYGQLGDGTTTMSVSPIGVALQ